MRVGLQDLETCHVSKVFFNFFAVKQSNSMTMLRIASFSLSLSLSCERIMVCITEIPIAKAGK